MMTIYSTYRDRHRDHVSVSWTVVTVIWSDVHCGDFAHLSLVIKCHHLTPATLASPLYLES